MYLLAYLGLFALQVENFKYLGMKVTNEALKFKSEYRQQTIPTESTRDS
jgi:hypothetical protein